MSIQNFLKSQYTTKPNDEKASLLTILDNLYQTNDLTQISQQETDFINFINHKNVYTAKQILNNIYVGLKQQLTAIQKTDNIFGKKKIVNSLKHSYDMMYELQKSTNLFQVKVLKEQNQAKITNLTWQQLYQKLY